MAKPARFAPKKTESGWRVNIPPKFSPSGKRERHFFPTQAKALEVTAKLKEGRDVFGSQSRAISPALAENATAAAALLEPWGISLLEAARIVVGIRERDTASLSLNLAADGWLASCEGLRPRTVRNYRLTVDRLRKDAGDRLMANITAADIQQAVAPSGTTGAAAMERIRNAKAFWRWAAGKGWCKAEIFAGVEMPKSSREAEEIAILLPDEAESILRVAEQYFPQAVSSFALQLFAGIRAEEIIRLERSHVTGEGIDLPASVTKKGRRRHITPSPTLEAWLAEYPFEPCSNWREVSAACRRMAGWKISARVLNNAVAAGTIPKPPAATRGAWPQNALRHSHASYAVASGVPLDSLLFEFGHSGNANLLRQHYVGRASKKQAIEFFAIGPKGTQIPAISAA